MMKNTLQKWGGGEKREQSEGELCVQSLRCADECRGRNHREREKE